MFPRATTPGPFRRGLTLKMHGFAATTTAADGCRVPSSRGPPTRIPTALVRRSAEAAPVEPGTAIGAGATVASRGNPASGGAAVVTGAAVTASAALITCEPPPRRLTKHDVPLDVACRAAVQLLENTVALFLADLVQ